MALTTKFINTPITINLNTSISSSYLISLSTGVPSRSSLSSIIINISSAISSTLYTVPTGRTAKVYLTPRFLNVPFLREVFSVSHSVASTGTVYGSFENGSGNFNCSVSYGYNTDIIEYTGSITTTLSYHPGSPISVVGGPRQESWQTDGLIVTGASSTNLQESLYEGGNKYIFMGAGNSLYLNITASLIYPKVIHLSKSSAAALYSMNENGSISATLTCYANFLVIEESGS